VPSPRDHTSCVAHHFACPPRTPLSPGHFLCYAYPCPKRLCLYERRGEWRLEMLSQRMSAYVSIRQRMRGEASGGLRCSRSEVLVLEVGWVVDDREVTGLELCRMRRVWPLSSPLPQRSPLRQRVSGRRSKYITRRQVADICFMPCRISISSQSTTHTHRAKRGSRRESRG
jgi:hypothetical protein